MIFHAVVNLTDLPFKSEIQQCNKKKTFCSQRFYSVNFSFHNILCHLSRLHPQLLQCSINFFILVFFLVSALAGHTTPLD